MNDVMFNVITFIFDADNIPSRNTVTEFHVSCESSLRLVWSDCLINKET